MTQITPFTAVPNRGMSQETLVDTTNTFFSEVGGFVGQANQLIGDINTAATNAIFTAPDWVAQAYESHKVVIYTDHNVYMSTEATLSIDVPSVSAKWQKLNASQGGSFDMQVFTSSGTWTKPTGASMVRIILCGGGGGGASGGKCGTTNTRVVLGGAGGGGGGVCDLTLPATLFNATENVVVGAGGIGGVGLGTGTAANGYSGMNGTTGGSTTFGTFSVGGGQYGSTGSTGTTSYSAGGGGGSSYITDGADPVSTTTNTENIYRRIYGGALTAYPGAQTVNYISVYGGAAAAKYRSGTGVPYIYSVEAKATTFGGAAGGSADGIYLTDGSTTRGIHYATTSPLSPQKFLPSHFGSYTSVGGYGGGLTSLTANGTSGANATGYGAGGGGGASCTENYTAGNGGNGSAGLAIIISW